MTFAQRVRNLTRCAIVFSIFVDSLGLTMGMSGILSGYTVVKAFSESSKNETLSVNTPSWDLGIVVSAVLLSKVLAFPTLFAPGMNNLSVVMYTTDTNEYSDGIIFNSVSTSSIVIPVKTTVAFILFAA